MHKENVRKESPMMRKSCLYYFDAANKETHRQFGFTLASMLSIYFGTLPKMVILCIGTDRVTGDSLGPLIGYKLIHKNLKNVYIYGTLDDPVHACNLSSTIDRIKCEHPGVPILAIDASLGLQKHQGYITLGKGTLHPGAGVYKDLPGVGDLYITGIVNKAGVMEHLALQTTRLSVVMNLADYITNGICCALELFYSSLPVPGA